MTQQPTDTQIRQLRDEAIAAGDYRQADLCDRALFSATGDEARAECARMIAGVECQYCHTVVGEYVTVPASDSSEEWVRLAAQHAANCEWIRTRAHRYDLRDDERL